MFFQDEKEKVEKPKLTLEEIQRIKEEFRLKREKEKEIRKQERDKVTFSKSIFTQKSDKQFKVITRHRFQMFVVNFMYSAFSRIRKACGRKA